MSQTRSGFSQLALADTLNAVAWARRHAVDVLCRWRVPPDTIQTARLIVSELMTNAIRHTHTDEEVSPYSPLSPVRKVTLTLWLERGRLYILVHDSDGRPPVVRVVGEDAESGRGVFPVEALSERWGYYPPGHAGKVVWSELLAVARDPRFKGDDTGSGYRTNGEAAAGRSYEDTPLVVARALVALREICPEERPRSVGLQVSGRRRDPHSDGHSEHPRVPIVNSNPRDSCEAVGALTPLRPARSKMAKSQ